jgi:hypothetical protein
MGSALKVSFVCYHDGYLCKYVINSMSLKMIAMTNNQAYLPGASAEKSFKTFSTDRSIRIGGIHPFINSEEHVISSKSVLCLLSRWTSLQICKQFIATENEW